LRPSGGSKKAAIDAAREWLEQIPWIVTITNSAVLISLVWLVHYLGFFLLVGTTAVVDLRVLGAAARNQKLAPLAGLLFPLAWTGLGLVIASGFIMFAGQATTFIPRRFSASRWEWCCWRSYLA